jgi:hypothetical protein
MFCQYESVPGSGFKVHRLQWIETVRFINQDPEYSASWVIRLYQQDEFRISLIGAAWVSLNPER